MTDEGTVKEIQRLAEHPPWLGHIDPLIGPANTELAWRIELSQFHESIADVCAELLRLRAENERLLAAIAAVTVRYVPVEFTEQTK